MRDHAFIKAQPFGVWSEYSLNFSQGVKRRAKGFRNVSNFISMEYIVADGLDYDRIIPGL
jgi:hypothetical protein